MLSDVSIPVPTGARWQCQCPSLVPVPSVPMLGCLLGNWMMHSNSILLEKGEEGNKPKPFGTAPRVDAASPQPEGHLCDRGRPLE